MINMTDLEQVKTLVQQIRGALDTPDGKEVMKFLEQACGWYESIFDPDNRDRILLNAGRREVVATLKTFLEQAPEDIVKLAQEKEWDYNG